MTLNYNFIHIKDGFLGKTETRKKSFPRGCVDRVSGGGVRIVYVCRQGREFPNCVRLQFSF